MRLLVSIFLVYICKWLCVEARSTRESPLLLMYVRNGVDPTSSIRMYACLVCHKGVGTFEVCTLFPATIFINAPHKSQMNWKPWWFPMHVLCGTNH